MRNNIDTHLDPRYLLLNIRRPFIPNVSFSFPYVRIERFRDTSPTSSSCEFLTEKARTDEKSSRRDPRRLRAYRCRDGNLSTNSIFFFFPLNASRAFVFTANQQRRDNHDVCLWAYVCAHEAEREREPRNERDEGEAETAN